MSPNPDQTEIHNRDIPEATATNATDSLQNLFELVDQMPAFDGDGDNSGSSVTDKLEAADGPRIGVDTNSGSPELLVSPSSGAPVERVGVDRIIQERVTGPMDIPTYQTRSDVPTSEIDSIALVYIEDEDEIQTVGT